MRRNPERTAWTILWSALAVFCLMAYLVPSGTLWWLRNAASSQRLTLSGGDTVYVQRPGRTSPEVNLTDIPVGSWISTPTNTQGSLTFLSPDGSETIASLQIYGDTQLLVERAESPRFGDWSRIPHRIQLNVATGRIRVFSTNNTGRGVEIEVRSAPDAVTVIDSPGVNASVEARPLETTVTVREGEASILAQGQWLNLRQDERALVAPNAPPSGPLPVERNLIRDGDFREAIGVYWREDVRNTAIPGDDPGAVTRITLEGRRAVNFLRLGQSWGQIGLVQEINQDVRDFQSLRLQMDVYLRFQSLQNCGSQGTECPVLVRIDYTDIDGRSREWLQGFYYIYNPDPTFGFAYCIVCSPRYGDHWLYEQNQWQSYESENLLALFRANNAAAAILRTITVYASGHTFDSNVAQIRLLASE
jgi:hypothetical protein